MTKIFVPATDATDWKRLLAEPEKQWKTGYSARALAHCWQDADGIPGSVLSVLSKKKEFEGLETLLAIPEHQVPLPGGSAASQNDVWALARCNTGLVSIAVEGKVSEPFGPTVGEWKAGMSKGKQRRIDYLCAQLELERPVLDDIRYQLMHRTVSSIIEAKRFLAAYAVMVVQSFSQSEQWFEDYARFLSLFEATGGPDEVVSAGRRTGVSLFFAWVRGETKYLTA